MLLGRVAVSTAMTAYSDQTFPVNQLFVCLSSALWKTADRIRMLFDMVGRTGPWKRQVWDRSTGRVNFWGKYGAPHCNQWGLFTIGNSHCAAARLLLGEVL